MGWGILIFGNKILVQLLLKQYGVFFLPKLYEHICVNHLKVYVVVEQRHMYCIK